MNKFEDRFNAIVKLKQVGGSTQEAYEKSMMLGNDMLEYIKELEGRINALKEFIDLRGEL